MPLLTNLQAYWKFDESSGDAVDSSSNGNTFVATSIRGYVAAKINNGVDLEKASSDSMTAADSASLSLTGDATWSWWENLESLFSGGDTDMFILTKSIGGVGLLSYQLRWNNQGSNNMTLFISSNLVTQGSAMVTFLPTTGIFQHIVLTFKASTGTMELWVNGISQGSATGTLPTSIADSTSALRLGNAGEIDGIFDEMGIWSRVLTSIEIGQLYNAGLGLSYPFRNANTDFFRFLDRR